MKITPLNDCLYIKALEDKQKITESGIYLPVNENNENKKDFIVGEVIALGDDVSDKIKEKIKQGTNVMFSYPTSVIDEPGNTFYIVKQLDLLGIVEF